MVSANSHMSVWGIGLAAAMLLGTACTKTSNEPVFDEVPAIWIIDSGAYQLEAFRDTLFLRVGYRDGDGDLGGFDSQSRVFVLDRRLQVPDSYELGQLSPEAGSLEGEFRIGLGPFFLLGNGNSESFELDIWISDRGGNESNRARSGQITVMQP